VNNKPVQSIVIVVIIVTTNISRICDTMAASQEVNCDKWLLFLHILEWTDVPDASSNRTGSFGTPRLSRIMW
jgi:hypothetical protein